MWGARPGAGVSRQVCGRPPGPASTQGPVPPRSGGLRGSREEAARGLGGRLVPVPLPEGCCWVLAGPVWGSAVPLSLPLGLEDAGGRAGTPSPQLSIPAWLWGCVSESRLMFDRVQESPHPSLRPPAEAAPHPQQAGTPSRHTSSSPCFFWGVRTLLGTPKGPRGGDFSDAGASFGGTATEEPCGDTGRGTG